MDAYGAAAKVSGLGFGEAGLIAGGSDASTSGSMGIASIDGLGPRGIGFSHARRADRTGHARPEGPGARALPRLASTGCVMRIARQDLTNLLALIAFGLLAVGCPKKTDKAPQSRVTPGAGKGSNVLPSRSVRARTAAAHAARVHPMRAGEELGGPQATGKPGDWVLENDEVVFVINALGSARVLRSPAETSWTPPTHARERTRSVRSSPTSASSRWQGSTPRSMLGWSPMAPPSRVARQGALRAFAWRRDAVSARVG